MSVKSQTLELLELGKALEEERRSASEKFTIVQNAVTQTIRSHCTDISEQLIKPSIAHSEKSGIASSVKDAKGAKRDLGRIGLAPLDLSSSVANVSMTRNLTVNSLLFDHFSSVLSSFSDGLGRTAQAILDGSYEAASQELKQAGSADDDPIRRSLLAEKAATDAFIKSAATLLVIERMLGDFRKKKLSISPREARDRIIECLKNTTVDDLKTAALDNLSEFVWAALDLAGDVFSLNIIRKWVVNPIMTAFGRRSISFEANHLDAINQLRDLVEEALDELREAREEAESVQKQIDTLRQSGRSQEMGTFPDH